MAAVPPATVQSPPPSSIPSQTTNEHVASVSEKRGGFHPITTPQPPPPPAYNTPPLLTWATALYAYHPTDLGDLPLLPNDRVAVTEYTNGDWWKGRNERTGMEGIFPQKYVQVVDEKSPVSTMTAPPAPSYGNMPLEVSQGQAASSTPATPGRLETHGKKFGKKLGDATIFGAVSSPNQTFDPDIAGI